MSKTRICTIVMLALLCGLLVPETGYAPPPGVFVADTCTNDEFFDFNNINAYTNKAQGIIQEVMQSIADALDSATVRLFEGITGSPIYTSAIFAAITLFVIFYGVAFLFGFVPLTLGQGIVRLVKIGLIATIVSPGGWAFFNDYVVRFFNCGTNELINAMVSLAAGGLGVAGSTVSATGDCVGAGEPFRILDESMKVIFSARMFVTILGTLAASPYGLIFGLGLLYAVFNFVMALLSAMQIYALSLIVKALLLGLAPIFLAFMLFERTKNIFMGWVNQLINFSLQPILLFAFLAFFGVFLSSAANDILPQNDVVLCYNKSNKQGNLPFDLHFWTFACKDGGGTPQPYSGGLGPLGPLDVIACPPGTNPPFPISIVNILIFIIVVHMMKQMNGVVVQMATEISQSYLNLQQFPNAINNWFSGGGGRLSGDKGGAELLRQAPK